MSATTLGSWSLRHSTPPRAGGAPALEVRPDAARRPLPRPPRGGVAPRRRRGRCKAQQGTLGAVALTRATPPRRSVLGDPGEYDEQMRLHDPPQSPAGTPSHADWLQRQLMVAHLRTATEY